jgi:hypothetical protein
MMACGSLRLTRGLVARLLVLAVALNWSWEMVQMGAYEEMAGLPWRSTLWRCFRASLGDAALTLLAAAVATRLMHLLPWTYAAAAVAAAALAVIVERIGLMAGAWSYSDRMPVVPALDVGLWPLLQLPLLVPLTLWAAVCWHRTSRRDRG